MTKSYLNGDLGAFIQDVLPKYQSYYTYCFYNKTVNRSCRRKAINQTDMYILCIMVFTVATINVAGFHS